MWHSALFNDGDTRDLPGTMQHVMTECGQWRYGMLAGTYPTAEGKVLCVYCGVARLVG